MLKRIDYLFDVSAIALAIAQNEALLKYIQLGLGIVATLLSLAFTIWKWWKKASEDGKITKEEVDDLIDELNDDIDDKRKGE